MTVDTSTLELSREIFDDCYLIPECSDKTERAKRRTEKRPGLSPWYDEDDRIHGRKNALLFDGEETLLFETLSATATDRIHEALDSLLDGDDLDYLVISHTDQPHCANAPSILDRYPSCTLVAPKYGQPDTLYSLGEAQPVSEGDVLELGGFEIEFCEAVFLDAPKSIWLYERTTDMLLTADWFSFTHTPEECMKFVDELERDLTVPRLQQFHARVFFWYQYADVDTVQTDIDRILEEHDPSVLVPSHGLVLRDDLEEHFEKMKEVVEAINAGGDES
jgi:flavorubredoxin